MNLYVDSSVVLRIVLGEQKRLAIWRKIEKPVSSELIQLECLRTLDRNRIRLELTDPDVARHRAELIDLLHTIEFIPLSSAILARASDPFPTMVGSLDAIHLASALLAREAYPDLNLATHDEELGVGAKAMGFFVHGAVS